MSDSEERQMINSMVDTFWSFDSRPEDGILFPALFVLVDHDPSIYGDFKSIMCLLVFKTNL